MRGKYYAAVIVAAGKSERFGSDKMLLPVAGVPVVVRSALAFERCAAIDEIVIVAKDGDCETMRKLCGDYAVSKLKTVVAGGETRTKSVCNGVFAVSKKADVIAVHDGARPLVTDAIIRGALDKAAKHHAAVPAVAVKPTVKRAKHGVVLETLRREELFEAQTPQAFDADLLKAALTAVKADATDEASLVEALGAAVYITEGSYLNIKITTAEDALFAETLIAMLESRGRGEPG